MQFEGVELCCPFCRGDLERDGTDQAGTLTCRACGTTYPIVCGIPDLRILPDPYIAMEADRAKGRTIAERAADLTFEQLIDFYYGITDVVPPEHARVYKAGLLGAVPRATAALDGWQGVWGHAPGRRFLDVGCGTGPMLQAADGFPIRAGVDIAFRWLVMGRKRLDEAGVKVPLICAAAEALPFPDAHFDCVTADSVIELLHDQARGLRAMRRVLTAGGVLWAATPNRWSLGPDPHTGLIAGSWLPERVVTWYMRARHAKPPVRRLLSAGRFDQLMRDAGFNAPTLFLADFPPEQRRHFPAPIRAGVAVYQFLKRMPAGRGLLRAVGPRLLAVARAD